MHYSIIFSLLWWWTCWPACGQVESELGLPELLIGQKGQVINTPDAWNQQRRPELLRLFEDNVYGQMPRDVDSIRFVLTRQDDRAMDGKAVLKEVGIDVYRRGQSIRISLVLFVPAAAAQPPPVFLLINHRDPDNIDPSRKVKSAFWPAEEVVARGYAVAAFQVSDVAADDSATYDQQVLRLYPEQLEKANGMKAIGAWAWGASRVMDYFETDDDVDASRVAVVGHSRGGKAALWCGAQDERFAITISNNSGCTGAALARRKVGERIRDINTNFPHWFCEQYQQFNGKEEELPVDQHMLIALTAPRAVYVASASEDAWADPKGEFLAVKYAEPAFVLFGLAPLPVSEQPPTNTPVASKHLGYHMRAGKHGLEQYDWERYIDFADAYFRGK